MNILFLSLGVFDDLNGSSVHLDVLKRFAKDNDVFLACKNENTETKCTIENGIHVLRIHTGVLKKVGLIKKGIATLLVEPQFKRAIQNNYQDVKFDLVIYTTPPITFDSAVKYIKKRDGALCYLMLKDIFPQNAVDIGILSKKGIKGLIYRYFRYKEKQLYKHTDYFGCMSPRNCEYLLSENVWIDPNKVEVCPNISVSEKVTISNKEKEELRQKYGIPLSKKVFVYGGNLGKPQDIPFVIECLKTCENTEAFFLIIGSGTEYENLEKEIGNLPVNYCKLMQSVPKNEYEEIVASCDVGLIFLDHRFTIPNFPSRLLSYMKAQIPVLAATDTSTDLGEIIESNGFGWWCQSDSTAGFRDKIVEICATEDLKKMGEIGFHFMEQNYNPEVVYTIITDKLKEEV